MKESKKERKKEMRERERKKERKIKESKWDREKQKINEYVMDNTYSWWSWWLYMTRDERRDVGFFIDRDTDRDTEIGRDRDKDIERDRESTKRRMDKMKSPCYF